MLFKQKKDFELRKIYNTYENYFNVKQFVLINLLNILITKKNLIKDRKRHIFLIQNLKSRLVSKVKIVRRCVFTNRGRQILRNYHISHATFRNLNILGIIPGCKKAIW